MKLSKRATAGVMSAFMVMGSLSVTGCSKNYTSPRNDQDPLVVTVGDSKVYMDEAKCYIFTSECEYQYYNEFFAAYMGTDDYWDQASDDDEDKTNREAAKDDVMDDIIEKEILYAQASDDDKYKVSDDEETTIKKNADDLIAAMSDKAIKKTGFSEDDFVKVQEKWNTAQKYKKDVIADFNVNKEDFEKDYDYDKDLKEYDSTYIRLSISTQDSSGNTMEVSESLKTEAKKTMDEIKKKIDSGKEFADVVKEYEDESVESSTMKYTQGNYSKLEDSKSEDTEAGEEYMKATIDMKKGAVSDVFEADGYYYIVKMDDNDSTAAYDSVIDEAVSDKENEEYDKWLDNLKDGDFKYTINTDVWDNIEFGELTIIPDEFKKAMGTLEDPAKKQSTAANTTTAE